MVPENSAVMDSYAYQHAGTSISYDGITGIVGLIFFVYSFTTASDAVDDEVTAQWQKQVIKRRPQAASVGFLTYSRRSVAAIDGEHLALSQDDIRGHRTNTASWAHSLNSRKFGGQLIQQLCCERNAMLPVHTFVASKYLAEILMNEYVTPMRIIPLSQRLRKTWDDILLDYPKQSVIRAWVRRQVVHSTGGHSTIGDHGGSSPMAWLKKTITLYHHTIH
jgi:hypothetical protein